MLQELTEEWEQCERKLRECREWADKSRQSLLDPLHARRRPIRDQMAAGERVAAEVAVQKQKAVMAVEKLQVRQGGGGCLRWRGFPTGQLLGLF